MPLMVSMLKITVVQSMAYSALGSAQHRDAPAMRHVGEHIAQRGGVARHLQADVEAFLHPQLALDIGEGSRCERPARSVTPIFLRQVEPVLVDVGDHDVARAGVADDGGGHHADRTGAGDQHVFAQHREA